MKGILVGIVLSAAAASPADPDAVAFAPIRRYRVADSATFAHPVPTDLGILIKDENGRFLHGRPEGASFRGDPRLQG